MFKLIFKKGHKSHALRLLGILLCVMASTGMVAYFINTSVEQTSKVSFKAAGVKYKEHFLLPRISSLPDTQVERTSEQKVQEILKYFFQALEDETSNSTLTGEVKQSEAKESMEIGPDLQILSSFNCVKSAPSVLVDYLSTMFLNQYGRSHKDFHSQQIVDEPLPLLKQFNINCGVDQNCSTSFQYDKQYGLNTTADNTFLRKDVFYCCPSVHSSANETMSEVCRRAQKVAERSVFRNSKESTFLGRVTEFSTHVILDVSSNFI